MKVIKSDSGFLAFQKLFKQIQMNNCPIVVWQLVPETGERYISESRLNSFHLDTGLLHLEAPQDNKIIPQLPVFCYSEDGRFIFKTEIQLIKSNVFSLLVPSEIKLLEEPDVIVIHGSIGIDISANWKTKRLHGQSGNQDDFMRVKSMSERSVRDQEFLNNEFESVSLDEEEKLFADKRESPRARPKIDKWVKVLVQGSTEAKMVRLFDLSRGGIGFVTYEAESFPKGNELQVIGFEEFDLDDPLVGKIMSHRAIDEAQIEFKIGVKFNDGQD
jgi:uncharacterized protein (DUF736 family)